MKGGDVNKNSPPDMHNNSTSHMADVLNGNKVSSYLNEQTI